MSLTNCQSIAAFDFADLSGCTQLIEESTHKHDNCLDLPLVDPPLGSSDHCSISFSVKMGFKIPNITFSRKVYLSISVILIRVRFIIVKIQYLRSMR